MTSAFYSHPCEVHLAGSLPESPNLNVFGLIGTWLESPARLVWKWWEHDGKSPFFIPWWLAYFCCIFLSDHWWPWEFSASVSDRNPYGQSGDRWSILALGAAEVWEKDRNDRKRQKKAGDTTRDVGRGTHLLHVRPEPNCDRSWCHVFFFSQVHQ